MSGDHHDKDYEVGHGKPPIEHQFPPGKSGNPRGRSPKRIPILVPAEIRRTVVKILDEEVQAKTGSTASKVSMFEAILRRIFTGAANGNPTHLRYAMKLMETALHDRIDAHAAVSLADLLQDIEQESPTPDPQHRKLIRAQVKHAKKFC